MESANSLPRNVQESRMVDLATLKSKIISTDIVLKKFHEKEAECNQLKVLKRRLETDCTTYERELKQVLEELLPAKKAVEEYKKLNNTQGTRINELEDDLKAATVISEQYCELAKSKEVENEELKRLKHVEKDFKKKDQQLEKLKLSNKKLLDETKTIQRKLSDLKKSYVKCLKTLVNISDKVGTNKNLTKRDSNEINRYKGILNASHSNETLENLLEDEDDDEDDEGSKLEKILQDEAVPTTNKYESPSLSDNENENFIHTEPEKSALKTPPKSSSEKLGREMIAKKKESPPCLEHHSYSLMSSSPLKRKSSSLSSPAKTQSLIITSPSINILRRTSPPPFILNNGISDSVTISDGDEKEHRTVESLLLSQEEIVPILSKTLKSDLSLSSSSTLEEEDIVPVDPNVSDVEIQMNLEDVTFSPVSLKILAQIKLNEKNNKLKINFDNSETPLLHVHVGENKKHQLLVMVGEDKTDKLRHELDKADELPVKADEVRIKFDEAKADELQGKVDEDKTDERQVKVDEGKTDELRDVVDEAKTDELRDVVDEAKTDELRDVVDEAKTDELRDVVDEAKTDELRDVVDEAKTDELRDVVDEAKTDELQVKDNKVKSVEDKNDRLHVLVDEDKSDRLHALVDEDKSDRLHVLVDEEKIQDQTDRNELVETKECKLKKSENEQSLPNVSKLTIQNTFEVNISREIRETVEYIIATVCSSSNVGRKISHTNLGEGLTKSSTLNVIESIDSVFVDESITVKESNDDEIKTTLRRVRRMTNRLSLSAMFERPISPLPPSPFESPSDSMFESMMEENHSEEDTALAPVEDLDELFGTDSEDDEVPILPPKPFQHQQSQGFDADFDSEERRPPPNPIIERLKRNSLKSISTKEKVTSLASTSIHPVQHYSSDQDSQYSPRRTEMDNEVSDFASNESEAPESRQTQTPTCNHTEPVNSPPRNTGEPRSSQTTGFNSKLKANFSHNSDTGNYSISIRLPDSTNPVKNLHFEIDTVSNEFTLNFGPGSHQSLEPNLALRSPPKNISQSSRKRASPSQDSCYESTFNSSKSTPLNSTPINSKSSRLEKGKKSATSKDPSASNKKRKETISTPEKISSKPLFEKGSASTKALPKFLPCNNAFINPRKPVEKVDKQSKSTLLQDIAPSIPPIRRPLLKLRNVSVDSCNNNSNPSNQIEEPSIEAPSSQESEETRSELIQPKESKETSKVQSKTVTKPQSKSDKSMVLEPEIPVLQPMVNKRISHLNLNKNGNKEMPVLTKKVKQDTIVPVSLPTKPLMQKRKPSLECDEKSLTDDLAPILKKPRIENDINDEMKMVRRFWKMFETPLVENLEMQSVLNEFKMSFETDAMDKEEMVNNIYNKLANPTIVSSSESLIEAIILLSMKAKRNPFTGSNKLEYPIDFEKHLVAVMFRLNEKVILLQNLIADFKDRVNCYLFVAHHKYLNGLGEITRLLSLVCKQEEDTQLVRMLCCNMLKDRPNISVFITGNVVISWPQVLARNKDENNLARDTFVKIILTLFTNESATLKRKAGQVIKKYLQINKDHPCHTFNVTETMKDLVNVYAELNVTDDELSEANLGLEMLAWYKTWSWTINYLIKKQLLPLFEDTNIKEKNLSYLVKLLGLLITNSKTKNKKEVSHIIKAFFKILTEQKSGELRDSALFNLLHLKNYLDSSQTQNLKKWMKNHHQTLDSKFLVTNCL